MPRDCHGRTLNDLQGLLVDRARSEASRISASIDTQAVAVRSKMVYEGLEASLEGDEWKSQIPGKPLLGQFATAAGIQSVRAKNLYIRSALESSSSPFEEIVGIIEHFATQRMSSG